MLNKPITFVWAILFSALLFAPPHNSIFAQQPIENLLGAGASFPYPLYSKWFDVYAKAYAVKVNYQSIGSGGGIRQLLNKTVDFGASDAYLTEDEMKQFDAKVLHIPTALGAVAIVYNLKVPDQIKLSPDIIADIFLGKIKYWNDPQIKTLNPDIKLPKSPIIVVHRSDGSGTTFIFTDYLSKVSTEWKDKVSRGKSVKWPTGVGGKGNEGVAGTVKQIPGTIGYVELIYAEKNHLNYAIIKNKAGNFVKPSLDSVTHAANVDLPDDLRIMITNSDAPQGYPICGFTWLLVYKEQNYANHNLEKAMAIKKLLRWCVTDAQQYNKELLYAPLPDSARNKALKLVDSLTYDNSPIELPK